MEHPPSHVNWTLSVVTSFGHETVACYVTESKSGGNTTDKFNSTHSVCCKLTKLRDLSTGGGKSWLSRPVDRGGGGGAQGVHAHPRSQKSWPDWVVKDLKCGDDRIDNFSAFPAVCRTQISIFSGGACPRTPIKPFQSVQPFRLKRDCSDFT